MKIFKFINGIFMLLLAFSQFDAEAWTLFVPVSKSYQEDTQLEPVEEEGEGGRRLPARRINCTIDSETGIDFGIEQPDILAYEIYTPSGICLASYSDEMEFIEYLFTLQGEYKMVFTTLDYDLIGWIQL